MVVTVGASVQRAAGAVLDRTSQSHVEGVTGRLAAERARPRFCREHTQRQETSQTGPLRRGADWLIAVRVSRDIADVKLEARGWMDIQESVDHGGR